MPDKARRYQAPKTSAKVFKPTRGKRPSAHKQGYTRQWSVFRLNWLSDHPLCVKCLEQGLYVSATEVDHIVPHCGDMEKFWDESNVQSLCEPCHSRKTATEDGGFGHPKTAG
jgi:5-methylcytosine-specific restriction protein A